MFLLQASANETSAPEDSDLETENFKFKKAFGEYWNNHRKQLDIFNEHLSLPNFNAPLRIFGDIRNTIYKAATFLAPAFNQDPDLYRTAMGVIEGGVNVLPTYSMIGFCYQNSTVIDDQFQSIIDNFNLGQYEETARSIASVLRSGNNILFNCFYTLTNPVEAAQYNRKFTWDVIGWNILFNLGFIYTNIKNSILFFYPAASPNTNDWNNFGRYIGDLGVRFIYSRYIERTYYKF